MPQLKVTATRRRLLPHDPGYLCFSEYPWYYSSLFTTKVNFHSFSSPDGGQQLSGATPQQFVSALSELPRQGIILDICSKMPDGISILIVREFLVCSVFLFSESVIDLFLLKIIQILISLDWTK
jgi:hypothetical protein